MIILPNSRLSFIDLEELPELNSLVKYSALFFLMKYFILWIFSFILEGNYPISILISIIIMQNMEKYL
jgi:hypothetical protein